MSVLIIWSDLVVKCQVKWIAIDWIAICKAMHTLFSSITLDYGTLKLLNADAYV